MIHKPILKTIFLFVFSSQICGCGYVSYLADPFCSAPAFHKVDEYMYRSGQPKKNGLNKLLTYNIRTVISLRNDSEKDDYEESFLKAHNINFYRLPMSIKKIPADETVEAFLEILDNQNNYPILIHCASGRDRTGAMIALYRKKYYKWTPQKAYKEAIKYGMWPYKGDMVLRDFIFDNDKT